MLYNFNFDIIDPDGNVVVNPVTGKKETGGTVLGKALGYSTKGDPLKNWSWAQKLIAGEGIELDDSDAEYVKKFIKDHEGLYSFTKAQLLRSMSTQEKGV